MQLALTVRLSVLDLLMDIPRQGVHSLDGIGGQSLGVSTGRFYDET